MNRMNGEVEGNCGLGRIKIAERIYPGRPSSYKVYSVGEIRNVVIKSGFIFINAGDLFTAEFFAEEQNGKYVLYRRTLIDGEKDKLGEVDKRDEVESELCGFVFDHVDVFEKTVIDALALDINSDIGEEKPRIIMPPSPNLN